MRLISSTSRKSGLFLLRLIMAVFLMTGSFTSLLILTNLGLILDVFHQLDIQYRIEIAVA